MIITIDGTNEGLSIAKLDEMISSYKEKNPGVLCRVFDCSEIDDINNLIDSLFESSLFSKKELLVIKRILGVKKDDLVTLIESILKSPKDIFIWSNQCIPKNTKVYKELSENGKFTRVEEPSKRDLNGWVNAIAQKEGVKLDLYATEKLIESQGADPALIQREIEKLSLLPSGKSLSQEDIETFASKHHSYEIWNLIRDIEDSNRSRAMRSFKNLIDTKVDPMFIFNMIAREYRLLYTVKIMQTAGKSGKEIAAETKIHPFVISNLQRSQIPISRITKIFEKLLNIDFQVKRSLIDPETALAILIKIL